MLALKWQGKIIVIFLRKNEIDRIKIETWLNWNLYRIRIELEGGAWCPDKPIGLESYEYIQIELHQLFFINAIETQGRFDNGQGKEYAEFYQIQYQRENNSSYWIDYYNKKTNKTIIKGNMNTYLPEKRFLSSPILAKRIRIIPYSPRWRTVCMRIELYGCPFYG